MVYGRRRRRGRSLQRWEPADLFMRLFVAAWLCGWAAGEFVVSRALQVMILCSADCERDISARCPNRLIANIATDDSLSKSFSVPFLTLWLVAWSCGGISMWQILLGTKGRLARAAPLFIVWGVLCAAFQRNAATLADVKGCRSPTIWFWCWLMLLPVLGLLARRRGGGRHSRFGRRAGGLLASGCRRAYEVTARGPLLAGLFGGAWGRGAGVPREEAVQQAATDLEQLSGELVTCAICISPLCTEPCAALTNRNRRRTCGHYFHLACMRRMAKSSSCAGRPPACPLCRRSYSAWMPMPDIALQPLAWFHAADADGDSRLAEAEIVEACAMSLPLGREQLRERLRQGGARPWAGPAQGAEGLRAADFLAEAGLREWLLAAREATKDQVVLSPRGLP